jgi:hypothetical protein
MRLLAVVTVLGFALGLFALQASAQTDLPAPLYVGPAPEPAP